MKRFYLLTLCLILFFNVHAQKKTLGHEDYKIWNNIDHREISNDGKWVAYDVVRQEDADPKIYIKDLEGEIIFEQNRSEKPAFTFDSRYVLFRILPNKVDVKSLKRIKTKKKDMPKDTLGILDLKSGILTKIPQLLNFKIPEKWSSYTFYQIESPVHEKDTTKGTTGVKLKKESKKNGYPLIIRNLKTARQDTFRYVTSYEIAEKGQALAFVTTGIDSVLSPGVYRFNFSTGNAIPVFEAKGEYRQIQWDEAGNQLAFLGDTDTTKVRVRPFGLYYWNPETPKAKLIVENGNSSLSSNWIISEHFKVEFSQDGSRLFFGTSPIPLLKDTLLLPDEVVNVEIWSYLDQKLATQQKVDLEKDKKKAYTAVVHINNMSVKQLGTKNMEITSRGNEGNADFALGQNYLPYLKTISWEGFPRYQDASMINMKTGKPEKIGIKIRGNISLSPQAKYAYWYEVTDSAWFAYSVDKKKTLQITNNETVAFYNETHNTPSHPGPYGIMGWSENDEKILIYDRFDIWEIDPEASIQPKNLTKNGRASKKRYRNIRLDNDERFISKNQTLLLSSFSLKDKQSGVYQMTYGKEGLKKLDEGPYALRRIKKSQNSKKLIYSKESFNEYPEIYTTDINFKTPIKISNTNPQQSEYKWGKAELAHWMSLDGMPLEGILIKPDNFDPNKKYPLMVYFYERMADRLHNHIIPTAGRSSINFSFYSSRDYVVFIPNVEYRIGYPGESAYNCVIPGITALINKGFIDKERIGVQGHSWGGYQIAYLITKTNIFKCAESGAPVSNMTSAYGGIRWGTGLSRMFQYEHTQSRIGGTLWEYPLRYIENSPIFFTDKINTPLLILHNDKDTAVPWYQGIEFFVALRRLGKPAWMINYQGEPHGITKPQNRKDFAIRMQQFFDYYLKNSPQPKWMKDGIPAIEVGIKQGYEFDNQNK